MSEGSVHVVLRHSGHRVTLPIWAVGVFASRALLVSRRGCAVGVSAQKGCNLPGMLQCLSKWHLT